MFSGLNSVLQTRGLNFTLLHDNVQSHTAYGLDQVLPVLGKGKHSDTGTLSRPLQSPELNCLELTWDMLQRCVVEVLNLTITQQ